MASAWGQDAIKPAVGAEDTVYEFVPPNNGAGPMWCFGSTCIVRHRDDVFVSGQETLKDAQPLHNTRWTLFRRGDKGWDLLQADEKGRQREPCPLGVLGDGRLVLSTNPTLTPPEARNGPANPHLLLFSIANVKSPRAPSQPEWVKNPGFTEHSYRGMGVDGPNREVVLLNNHGYEEQYWAFLDRDGKWASRGILKYPIRACYPNVALANRACHVLAIGDIIKPNEEWRKWKFERSGGKSWDYVFRRLFYVWTPNVATTQFAEPVEVDNVDATAGHMFNTDIWVDKAGAAHLLYRKITVQNPALRDKFLPGAPIRTSLEHCVVKDNKVVSRRTLILGGEGAGTEIPNWARLHATPDGRLFVLYHCGGKDADGKALNENRLMELRPDGTQSPPVTVPLKRPFGNFMTATERGGSPPSTTLDILGTCTGKPEICYARIRLW